MTSPLGRRRLRTKSTWFELLTMFIVWVVIEAIQVLVCCVAAWLIIDQGFGALLPFPNMVLMSLGFVLLTEIIALKVSAD